MNNAEYIRQRLRGIGLNNVAIAGILGTLDYESAGLQTDATNSSSGAYGIGQWLGSRADNLKAKHPNDYNTIEGQTDFLISELGDYSSMLNEMQNCGSAAKATEIFTRQFERPSAKEINNSLAERERRANGYFDGSYTGGNSKFMQDINEVGMPLSSLNITPYIHDFLPDTLNMFNNAKGYTFADAFPEAFKELMFPKTATWQEKAELAAEDGIKTSWLYNLYTFAKGTLEGGGTTPYVLDDAEKKRIENALPDDKDAQEYVMLHADSKQDADLLIQKKQEDLKRKRMLSQLNVGYKLLDGAVGMMADPTTYIPVGIALNGAKIVERTGEAVYNMRRIAQVAKMATLQAGLNTASTALNGYANGDTITPKAYVGSAVMGAVAGGLLGAMAPLKGIATADDVVNAASKLEDNAIKTSMDYAPSTYEQYAVKERAALNSPTNKIYFDTPTTNLAALHEDEFNRLFNGKLNGELLDYDAGKVKVYKADTGNNLFIINADKVKEKTPYVKQVAEIEKLVNSGLAQDIKGVNKDGFDLSLQMFSKKSETMDKDIADKMILDIANDKLPKKEMRKIIKARQKRYRANGLKVSNEQVKQHIMQAAYREGLERGGIGNGVSSKIANGERISNKSLVPYDEELLNDIFSDNISSKDMKRLSPWLEKGIGFINKTPFGYGIQSPSKVIRNVANKLLIDSRQRAFNNIEVPAETMHREMMNHMNVPMVGFRKCKLKWLGNTGGILREAYGRSNHMKFDEQVLKTYETKYAGAHSIDLAKVEPEVLSAADHVNALRKLQVELGKTSASRFGVNARYNLIEPEWEEVDPSLWRVVDTHAMSKFLSKFDYNMDKATDFLTSYIKRAANNTLSRERIKAQLIRDNRLHGDGQFKPTEADVDNVIETSAESIAKRWLGESAEEQAYGSRTANVGSLKFFQKRLPIDSDMIAMLPDGTHFSFNNNLRDYNLERIMQATSNRIAGEASIRNKFGNTAALDKVYEEAQKELKSLVQTHKLDAEEADKQFEFLKEEISIIRGFKPNNERIGKLGALANIMRQVSYAKNGYNMGFNQLQESLGALAYNGWQALSYCFPVLRKFVEDVKYGKIPAKQLEEELQIAFGDSGEKYLFSNFTDNVMRDALTKPSLVNKLLINASERTKAMGMITSKLNRVSSLTEATCNAIRKQGMYEINKWAQDDFSSILRTPFSNTKLKAAGIKDVEQFKSDIRDCLRDNGTLDSQKLMKEHNATYWKWYTFIEQRVKRSILSGTEEGNRNMYKDANAFTRMIFQFKDFGFRALNGHFGRMLTTRERDDAMSALITMGTSAFVYAARIGLMAELINLYGDYAGSQAYLASRLTPENLMRAAIFRSSFLGTSPIANLNDFYEMATGAPTIRTTVTTKGQKINDAGDIAGNIVRQLPAVQSTVGDALTIGKALGQLATDDFTQRSFQHAMNATIPFANFIPMQAALASIANNSFYPKDTKSGAWESKSRTKNVWKTK